MVPALSTAGVMLRGRPCSGLYTLEGPSLAAIASFYPNYPQEIVPDSRTGLYKCPEVDFLLELLFSEPSKNRLSRISKPSTTSLFSFAHMFFPCEVPDVELSE